MGRTFRRTGSAGSSPLDRYDVACLAGGPQRVAETALLTLHDRGVITITGPRVRAEEQAEHPVERVLTSSCPNGRSVTAVLAGLTRATETEEIGRRLVSLGLLTRARRPTRVGRRRLELARESEELPAYVFDGPAAHPERRLRRAVRIASPAPSGLGRMRILTSRTVDPYADDDSGHAATDSGGGFGDGGGGGGD
ncbi:TIGR04222 domain-containing membrane protein [Streptomyces sp. B6B3]|uniref:TIGR04222 domain-containing membrane protein n=1 Tax=Streptomyces sp. B6B3 TaxID=3153570 RepID=UPI00325F5633